jgi:hypothetical protein
MPHPTDELVGHRIVFALAQVPKESASGHRMASLAPLMDLDTGKMVQANAKNFPSDGYVFWWSVPNLQLSPGDLVVGILSKASEKFYGSMDQSWYQVSPDTSPCNGEVFEIVKTTLDAGTSLRRLVDGRKMIDNSYEPPRIYYVWVDEQMVGPFYPQRFESFQSPTGYCCAPADRVNNVVKVLKGSKLSEYVSNEVGYCEVYLSSTTNHPAKDPRSRFVRRYRLIRKEDLAGLSDHTQELVLPTDDFAITKACNLLEGRNNKRDAKTLLATLVEKLRTDEQLLASGVVQAVEEIATRVTENDEAVDRIATALANSEVVNKRIAELGQERVDALVLSRANEIQSEAERLSEEVLEKLKEADKKLENAGLQLLETEAELERCKKEIDENESRFERVVKTATTRLSQGRDELLSDISLLGPIFGGNLLAERNGHATASLVATQVPHASKKRTTQLLGEPLIEMRYVDSRLVPVMREFGLVLPSNKAADFHALMVASNLVSLPDVSWGVAYAASMGGSAISHCVTVEPNWMSFSQVFDGDLGRAFSEAVNDEDRLHIIILDGIDRCPSHAWLQPFFQLNAGWRASLPNRDESGWPSNLRLVFVEEKSCSCFPVPEDRHFLKKWAIPFLTEPAPIQETVSSCVEGHLPFETWKLNTSSEEDFAFESLLRELSMESCLLEARLQRSLTRRLRDVYVRLGRDEDRVSSAIRWLLRMNVAGMESSP